MSKINDYRIAKNVLEEAQKAIAEGAGKHGDTHNSFTMIGQMWAVYLEHVRRVRTSSMITGYDVAQMLSMVKVVRATYGFSPDNPVDQVGYSSLAAMLHPLNQLDLENDVEKSLEEKDEDDGSPVRTEGSAQSS